MEMRIVIKCSSLYFPLEGRISSQVETKDSKWLHSLVLLCCSILHQDALSLILSPYPIITTDFKSKQSHLCAKPLTTLSCLFSPTSFYLLLFIVLHSSFRKTFILQVCSNRSYCFVGIKSN